MPAVYKQIINIKRLNTYRKPLHYLQSNYDLTRIEFRPIYILLTFRDLSITRFSLGEELP